MQTRFDDTVHILGDLYANYKSDENFKDFIEYNDMGLPLAFLASESLCDITSDGSRYILETWNLFIDMLGIEDTGFESLVEVFDAALGDT
jgi:hypothetical protein